MEQLDFYNINNKSEQEVLDIKTKYKEVDCNKLKLRVNTVYERRSDLFYVGTTNGLYTFNGNKAVKLKINGQEINDNINSIAHQNLDGESIVWVATVARGIYVIKEKEILHLTMNKGLPSNNFKKVHVDDNNKVWLASNRGVLQIELENNKPLIERYDINSGLASNEVNDIIVKKGNIYAATIKGLTVFQSKTTKIEQASPIYLTNLKVGNKPVDDKDEIQLEYNEAIQVNFTGIDFEGADKLNYRYKLDGLDDTWHSTTNRELEYSGLQPGEYTLYIFAGNEVVKSKNPIALSFIIHPPFWSTWWFKSLIITMIMFIIFIFFRIRVFTYNKDVVREIMLLILDNLKRKKYITVKSDGNTVIIDEENIQRIEAAIDYVNIFCADKTYLVHTTMKKMEETLKKNKNFLRVHRSHLVHINKVQEIGNNYLVVQSEKVPVGISYRERIKPIKESLTSTGSYKKDSFFSIFW